MFKRVLIQEEELFLPPLLENHSFHTTLYKNNQELVKLLQVESFDLFFCTDLPALKMAKSMVPSLPVIVIASSPAVADAVEAMRLGALDYLSFPLKMEELNRSIDLAEKRSYLKKELSFYSRGKWEQIITVSPSMKAILEDILKIAKSSASVFISGESGTGKEVIAHTIHNHSPRLEEPFIKVNCAAIPEALLEAEFFGHEKGAFTGALEKRLGRFELANQGTLLLDEVSEIPLNMQAKLLRAIQEQEFERVGSGKPIRVNVRFIATSNRNMKETIEQKLFREDLYYRLNVVPIRLPSLRERKEDILSLASYFLDRFCEENHKKPKQFSSLAKKQLLDYHWPGNIRELANVIERTVVMDLSEIIEPDHLKIEISCPLPPLVSRFETTALNDLEKRHILQTLSHFNHNKTHAAKSLGISIRTLRNKLSLYKL